MKTSSEGERTALPQTIGALRAGSVRGPCTELVSQLIRRVCGVAVFAEGAGKNSIAVCFTGRLYGNSLIIMVQRGQLRIGGMVAAGAGFVSVPTLFRTGGGFCCVLLQIMLCGQLFAGGIAAADAAVVSVPADFRTGGGFCSVVHQIMVIWVFFAVFPTTRLTDRFGAAGCCAAETACSINFGAVVHAAADVCAVAGG